MKISILFYSLIQSLSEWIFNIAEAFFSFASTMSKFEISDGMNLLFISPLLFLLIIKSISLASKSFNTTDYFIKNKVLLSSTLILCIFSILQNEIISFSLNSFDSLFDSAAILDVLRGDFSVGEYPSEINLSISIITMFSASSAALIALSEILSILSLKITFVLIPLIALLGIYYPKITDVTLKSVIYGLLYPMIQTFIMFFTLTHLLPAVTSESTLLMNSIFKVVTILLSYQLAKTITDAMFLQKGKYNSSIETPMVLNS